MKKWMNFLFGKKYPIFNPQGKIEHKTKKFFKNWSDFYNQDSERDWRNHKGYGQFRDEEFSSSSSVDSQEV